MEILMAAPQSGDFNTALAVQAALLHDTVENTETLLSEIEQQFGKETADAVDALTKNETLPEEEQIPDSVQRIKRLSKEVWAVKLADRITNLMPPPGDWNQQKIRQYADVSRYILDELGEANEYLAMQGWQKR